MAYGNSSVSALMAQAKAALKKQQSLEEEIAAYEYDLSAKDQESFARYQKFLTDRANLVRDADPSKALSLQRKITGAQRSFTSSQIQRESIAIAEGSGTKQTKLNSIINLYRAALENGDEATAQRLQLQADQLQIQIQNEAMAAAGRGGGGGSGSGTSGYTLAIKKAEAAKKDIEQLYKTGKISVQQYRDGIMKTLEGDGVNQGLMGLYQAAAEDPGVSESSRIGYESKINDINTNQVYQRSIQDVNRSRDNDLFNPSQATKFNPITGQYDIVNLKPMGSSALDNILQPGQAPILKFGTDNKDEVVMNRRNVAIGEDGRPIFENGKPVLTDVTPNLRAFSQQVTPGEDNSQRYALEYSAATGALSPIAKVDNFPAGAYIKDSKGEMLLKEDKDKNGNKVFREYKPEDFQEGSVNGLIPASIGEAAEQWKQGAGEIYNNTSQLTEWANKNKYVSGINKLARTVGYANPLSALPNLVGSGFGNVGQLKGVFDHLTNLKKQSDEKARIEAARRVEEDARFRAANAAAQAALNAQRSAPGPVKPLWQTPNKLPASTPGNQPDARSIGVIRSFVEDQPFGKSLYRL